MTVPAAPLTGSADPPPPQGGGQGRFVRRGLLVLLIRLFGAAMTLAVTILLSRGLGAESYGVYSQVFAVITLATMPTQFGLPELVVRESSGAISKGRPWQLSALWRWAHVFIALNSAGIIFLIWLASRWIGNFFAAVGPGATLIALAIIPAIALSNLRAAILRGLGYDLLGHLPEHALRPTAFVLGLLALLFVSPARMDVPSVLVVQFMAYGLSTLVGAMLLMRLWPRTQARKAKRQQKRLWARSTFLIGTISGLLLINNSVDIIMLGVWDTDSEVGIYRLASVVAALITLGHQTLNIYAMPYFSRLLAAGDTSGLAELARRVSQMSTGFSVLAFVVILLAGERGLALVLGAEFAGAMPILLVLAAGHIVNAALGASYTLLVMARNENDAARITLVGTLANIVLNLFLIPVLGGVGAAIASSVSVVLTKLISFVLVYRRYNVACWPFPEFGARPK